MLGKVTTMLLVLFAVSKLTYGQGAHQVSIGINPALDLKFVNGTSAIRHISLTSKKDLEEGVFKANQAMLQIQANQNWKLTVSAGFPLFSYFNVNNPVNPNMPSEVLQFRKSGATEYSALSYSEPFEIATGTPGAYKDNGHGISVDYFANPGFNYPEGLYFINVFYTASAQ